jgi:hypothetical protein
MEGIVLDDKDAALSGDWRASRASAPFLGPEYFHDGNTHDGKTKALFTVGVPKAGSYRVKVLYPPHENRASNAPVTINGTAVRINQKKAGEWLGPFQLPRSFTVTVSNEGANGYVVIDGLQVVEAKP